MSTTAPATPAQPASWDDPGADWPAPQTMVLRARPLRAGTRLAGLPRYRQASWDLRAAHPDRRS